MKKIELLHFTVAKKNECQLLDTVEQLSFFCHLLESGLARINWIRAVDKICVEQLICCQKCRANDCRAIAFRAVHPHSSFVLIFCCCCCFLNVVLNQLVFVKIFMQEFLQFINCYQISYISKHICNLSAEEFISFHFFIGNSSIENKSNIIFIKTNVTDKRLQVLFS